MIRTKRFCCLCGSDQAPFERISYGTVCLDERRCTARIRGVDRREPVDVPDWLLRASGGA